ncbi:hypothetical protein FB451DRAFT_1362566 [Mycena latifolia]|nr:hypothetical protein FB451DRAFT_1362566 [Mycena latifolia]
MGQPSSWTTPSAWICLCLCVYSQAAQVSWIITTLQCEIWLYRTTMMSSWKMCADFQNFQASIVAEGYLATTPENSWRVFITKAPALPLGAFVYQLKSIKIQCCYWLLAAKYESSTTAQRPLLRQCQLALVSTPASSTSFDSHPFCIACGTAWSAFEASHSILVYGSSSIPLSCALRMAHVQGLRLGPAPERTRSSVAQAVHAGTPANARAVMRVRLAVSYRLLGPRAALREAHLGLALFSQSRAAGT